MKRPHVVLAVGNGCWGENLAGMRVARDLERAGERCVVVANVDAARMFRDAGLDVRFISVSAERIAGIVAAERPASVILADHLIAGKRVDAAALGVPLVAIDTWSSDETGRVRDVFAGQEEVLPACPPALRLVPVPFARPTVPGACALLPDAIDHAARAAERALLGIDPHERVVLLTTAEWQHQSMEHDPAGRALARAVLAVLARVLDGVRVLHVGPRPLLGLRQIHLAPQRPAAFARTLACADVVLSLNVAASTLVTAVVSGIPAVVVACARGEAPLFPYWLWPVGMRRYLDPLLAGNPYLDTLDVVDITDEDGLRRALAGGPRPRSDYLAQVAALPRPSDLILGWLR